MTLNKQINRSWDYTCTVDIDQISSSGQPSGSDYVRQCLLELKHVVT